MDAFSNFVYSNRIGKFHVYFVSHVCTRSTPVLHSLAVEVVWEVLQKKEELDP